VKHFYRDGQLRKAKKRVFHVIQMLMFAIQVAERGYVYNYLEGQQFWSITNRDFDSLEDFTQMYEPLMESLINTLRNITNKYREFELRLAVERPEAASTELPLVSYIKAHGLEAAPLDLSIELTRHKLHPNLVHFRYHRVDSPFDTDISNDAKSLVLDESNNWKIVSFGFKRFFAYDKSASKVTGIDLATAKFTERLNGHHVVLYQHGGADKWNVATRRTADGSELYGGGNLTLYEAFWSTWKRYVFRLCFVCA
jgi:hypothetical protein